MSSPVAHPSARPQPARPAKGKGKARAPASVDTDYEASLDSGEEARHVKKEALPRRRRVRAASPAVEGAEYEEHGHTSRQAQVGQTDPKGYPYSPDLVRRPRRSRSPRTSRFSLACLQQVPLQEAPVHSAGKSAD